MWPAALAPALAWLYVEAPSHGPGGLPGGIGSEQQRALPVFSREQLERSPVFPLEPESRAFFLFARVPPHARVTLRFSQFAKEPHFCCLCRQGVGCCIRLRPPRPQDFSAIIPGHGGVFDRIDCQLIMGLFTYTYYSTFVQNAGAQARLGVSLIMQCRRDRTMRHV